MRQGLMPAADLIEGDRVDFDENAPYITEANKPIAAAEYAFILGRKGWLDSMAKPGEVVLYTENFAEPIILPADTQVHVERWH
jgi:hypothetical protein